MKAYIICIALCSLTHAVYISRMSSINRLRPATPFRPGVKMQGPWVQNQARLVQAASHRSPYVLYRNPPHRYAVKHYKPTRNIFAGGPWKTTGRLPLAPSNAEYEFVKAASAPPLSHTDGGTGAIHTIPAPNLSLSEKPIVVIDTTDSFVSHQPKSTYEVTEKYQEPELTMAKIETPVGFSKATSLTTPELETLIRHGAALQVASEFGLPISVPQRQVIQPQPYPVNTFNALPSQQDLLNARAEGIFIPPNALYQQDPMFLQKLQNHLLQRFPAVEFIPYPADSPQIQNINLQAQASQYHPQVIIVDDQINKHVPEKNIVQRETQENTFATLIPQSFKAPNVSIEKSTPQPLSHNITLDLQAAESEPVTTTIKYVVESNTEEQNTTPIYYAQIGQSIGNVIANGFYSAINDVRAAAALAQVETPQQNTVEIENITTTTTMVPNVQAFFVQNEDKNDNKTDLKPILGVPFRKSEEPVNVAYTLLRTGDKEPKVTEEGTVYAGQIVEATVSEDNDFNKEKANLISRRAPIRLFTEVDTNDSNISSFLTNPTQEVTVVKAKIPPKTKLTFDDKTGEPILRIYASYADNLAQKEAVIAKLAIMKHSKDVSKDPENWKGATVKTVAPSQGIDANKVTQFGLKLRSRSDDYIPLFEEYDD